MYASFSVSGQGPLEESSCFVFRAMSEGAADKEGVLAVSGAETAVKFKSLLDHG